MAQNTVERNPNAGGPPEQAGLQTKKPQIVIQGGLYTGMMASIVDEEQFMSKLKEAARKGYEILKDHQAAVEAVQKALCILEESDLFNAGHGSFFTKEKHVECDAMIMDGHNLKAGAVAAVRDIPHPVLLSRTIMENSEHCILCSDGALEFAQINGIEVGSVRGREPLSSDESNDEVAIEPMDTVSAIAMDCYGHLACATSSGGIPFKAKGRIGDAPLIGCGGYANKFGAATTCGHGESIIKMTLAKEVVNNIGRQQQDAQVAAQNAVNEVRLALSAPDQDRPYVGVIAMDDKGNIGIIGPDDQPMPWVKISDDLLEHGKYADRCDDREDYD